MELTYVPLNEEIIPALAPIMKRSFDFDTMRHIGEEGGPPGYDDGSFLREWGLHPDSTAFSVYVDDVLAGCLIVWIFPHGENHLGCIFLDPDYIGKGLGVRMWQWVEETWPDAVSWTTETPLVATANLRYYVNNCGFQIYHIERDDMLPQGMAQLRKVMPKQRMDMETVSDVLQSVLL